jgi:hypothetical protein
VPGFDLFPSKPSLLDGFAYLSLFSTLFDTLWPKVTHVIAMVACDIERGIVWVLCAKDRIQKARKIQNTQNTEQRPQPLRDAS